MRTVISLIVLGLLSATAAAQGLPKNGDALPLTGNGDWGKLAWSYNSPSQNDAAGKVVIHWFCTPRVQACLDDLSRIVAHKENGGVYVIAYINGTQRDAKKLDPIRESEGVGRGTLATGPGVKKLFKTLGIAKGPASIIVDVDGKVKAVTTSGDLNELDARDAMVKQLVDAVKPYTTSNEGPKGGKPTDKLTFTFKVQLANWLTFSSKTPSEFTLTAAKELKCNATTLKGDQLKIEGHTMTAQVTCTAPKGKYEARGAIRFGYESPGGATGLGDDGATWKFEIAP